MHNLKNAKNIHFIGIGGISMSGLAEVLKRDKYNVTGSDDMDSEIIGRLKNFDIPVSIPNAAENINGQMDMIVYTAAVKPTNPEYQAGAALGIQMVERAALIGMMLEDYEHPICIAGTHGKTTTTSMMGEITLAAGLDPTISIGGLMNHSGMNYRVGNSSYFVLEACEYNNSFHHWHPKVGLILNIDADHLDFFGSLDNIVESFAKFAGNIRKDGVLVVQSGITGFEKVTANLSCEVITFGEENARFTAKNIEYINGRPSFDVLDGQAYLAHVNLQLPGRYNILNALASFATASWLGIPAATIASALSSAKGAKRRFELKGTLPDDIDIIDDYAHHPTEIRSCLTAAKASKPDGRIICLFQPHTYTRTKNLFTEFAQSFTNADMVLLLPIYAARESFDPNISSEALAEAIKNNGQNVIFIENFDKAGNFLKNNLCPGDTLLTMGAGNVYQIGEGLLQG